MISTELRQGIALMFRQTVDGDVPRPPTVFTHLRARPKGGR